MAKYMAGHDSAPKHARGGAAKMGGHHMLPQRGIKHYEAHARGMHRVDDVIKGAPHTATARTGLMNTAKMPNPSMGKGRGRGGY